MRPNLKHRYPLVPMERYITWRRPDGTHLDPWLRTHERLGAEIVRVAPESMRVPGTVAEWEEWAGMAFPESGSYVVPGALVPVEVDRERDEGLYVEPNVWMVHPAGLGRDGQRERDAGPALGPGLGPDPAAVGLDEAACDREPEAGSRLATRPRPVLAPEAVEHPRRGFRRQPVAGVLDADLDLVRAEAGGGPRPSRRRACGGGRS